MEIKTSLAMQAYQQSSAIFSKPLASEGESFLNIMQELSAKLSTHESTARSAMLGQADPHDLVQALTASQHAVETVVAVRDKVVAAYQELMRMPV